MYSNPCRLLTAPATLLAPPCHLRIQTLKRPPSPLNVFDPNSHCKMYLVKSSVFVALIVATSRTAASNLCAQFSPSPIPIHQLPSYFPSRQDIDVSTILNIEAIRQVISLYPLAIDGKDFTSLASIFAPDAVANYSAPLGVLTGTPAITTALEAALATFLRTQHHLGTSNIHVCDNQKQAISTTYYRAVHFLSQNGTEMPSDITSSRNVLYAYGQYQDTWEKRDRQWRIIHRSLVYMVSLKPEDSVVLLELTSYRVHLSPISIEPKPETTT